MASDSYSNTNSNWNQKNYSNSDPLIGTWREVERENVGEELKLYGMLIYFELVQYSGVDLLRASMVVASIRQNDKYLTLDDESNLGGTRTTALSMVIQGW